MRMHTDTILWFPNPWFVERFRKKCRRGDGTFFQWSENSITEWKTAMHAFDWWGLLSPRTGHRNCPGNVRLSKQTDMTIHWKALFA
jgi:hypothetical protein